MKWQIAPALPLPPWPAPPAPPPPFPPAAPPLEESKGRLILRRESADAAGRLEVAEAMLAALLPRRRRRKAA